MVHIYNRTGQTGLPLNRQRIVEICSAILADFKQSKSTLTVTFVGPEKIQQLNRDFLESDSITDVLSFPSDGEIDPETGRVYLGDILICYQRALEQADRAGHAVMEEISLLFIHGLLHLLGFDHAEEEEKQEMWHLQQFYLDQFDVKLARMPGEDDGQA